MGRRRRSVLHFIVRVDSIHENPETVIEHFVALNSQKCGQTEDTANRNESLKMLACADPRRLEAMDFPKKPSGEDKEGINPTFVEDQPRRVFDGCP